MITRKRLALATATVALGSGLALGPAAGAFAAAPQTTTARSSAAAAAAVKCPYTDGVGLYCGYNKKSQYADFGDTGSKVKEIQALIRYTTTYGNLAIDGSFGKNTRSAVKYFQKKYMGDNTPDGIVGPQTWKALRVK